MAIWATLFVAVTLFFGTLAYVYLPRSEAGIELSVPFNATDDHLPGNPSVSVKDPVRIVVASASIDARVEQVGITAKNTMAVPRSMYTVGWYRHGTKPGENGTALFAGHVDNALGLDGVFADLENVKAGDLVLVEDAEGKSLSFRVDEVRTVPYNFKNTEELFGFDSQTPRIALVTCGGTWLQEAKTYSERLVVIASLATE